MRKKRLEGVLMIEAVVCIAFCLLQINYSGIFTTAAAFPFEQLGLGLRALSLSGGAGNVLALILYFFISLIPAGIWALLKKRKKAYRADIILVFLSILLLPMLYYMVNPGLFGSNVPGTGKWLLGGTFYSVLFGYGILRILEIYSHAGIPKLQSGLKLLLFLLNIVLVYLIFGQNLGTLLQTVQQVKNDNAVPDIWESLSGASNALMPTFFFLVLHYIVNMLPYLLDIVTVFLAVDLLDALAEDRYSDRAVRAVERLSGFCVKALMAAVTAAAAFHILQAIFHRQLYQVDVVIVIPVFSVIFVLAVLLYARYIREDQKLKRDHDLFI
ncbi:MAG: hypothetical protein Q4E91_06430 [Lachnospiraceae bacterium]|nr:hypothetical protein [Lachnospiraceae bacterium]